MLKKGLLILMAIALAASLTAATAMVSNPAFAGTGFKNKADCIKYLVQNLKLAPNVAAKSCSGPFAG